MGRFRSDLYYRIHVVPIHLPALRERREDIIPLALHFLENFNRKYKKHIMFSDQLIRRFEEYDWPGNIRQLENEIERIVILSKEGIILSAQLSQEMIFHPNQEEYVPYIDEDKTYRELIEEYEKQIFTLAFQRNLTSVAVAKALHIGQTTAARKLRKYIPGYSGLAKNN
jgi:transcriptional regulator with PAS, ATPase and Fis domain